LREAEPPAEGFTKPVRQASPHIRRQGRQYGYRKLDPDLSVSF